MANMNDSRDKTDIINQILNTPIKLSEEQERAVVSKNHFFKVIAGAGAGKTETLTRRIAYLLLVEEAQPSEIVAFTFTEKAAQSMKDRIYQRVEAIAGSPATANLGEMYIGTIHGYAMRLLEDHFGYGNYSVLDENQEIAFLLRHSWGLVPADYGNNQIQRCSNFLRTVNMVWDEMLDPNILRHRAKDFYTRLTQYQELLENHRLLTFGRMTNLAASKLDEKPEVIAHIKHLVVDEYQDINRAQELLIEAIGKTASVFVVGDPRQCIYQWRGSDEGYFRRFSGTFPDAGELPITENRRSGKCIVENANKFASSFEQQYPRMVPNRDDDGFFGVIAHETFFDEASWLADQVEMLVNNKGVSHSDICVLMRSVSTSAGPILDEFRRRRIPFIVGGKVGLFRREEAQAVGRIFAWFYDEGFWVENPWKWNEQVRGDDLLDTALMHWANAIGARVPPNARTDLVQIKDEIYLEKGRYYNFTQIYHDVLRALGFHQMDHTDRNDAVIMANLGRFSELLTDYETANRLGGRSPKWRTDMKGLCWFINSYASQAYEEPGIEYLKGVDAVQVMTVHQAKGLEWPVVFLTSMIRGRFPSGMIGRAQNWCDVPRDLFDVERYEGNEEDERRLCYVAITRAMDALVVSYFNRINQRVSRSIFIEDMDVDSATNITAPDEHPSFDIRRIPEKDEMQTFTAGELITYQRCPYLFLLGNILGYQPGLNPRIGYGNSLHHCMRRASELVKNQGYIPQTAIATAVDEDFHMPFMGGDVLETFKNSARKRLLEFAKKRESDFGRIEEVEYRLEFPIQGATVSGRVDVILKDGGDLEVREYKTSEKATTFEESSVQVQLYALGLRSMGRPIKYGSVAYLEDADVRDVSVTDSVTSSIRTNAEMVVAGIVQGDFKPKKGERCTNCDQKSICRWGCG
jgi:DNA helicase-2/ATP-dependent DNA helicase PcrA